MQMDVGLDTGPMLAKKSIRIKPDDTAGSVLQALSTLGADLLIETLPEYFLATPTFPQPAEGAHMLMANEDGFLILHTDVELGDACAIIRGRVV
jgi:methionyl-tRNA formyltransferase